VAQTSRNFAQAGSELTDQQRGLIAAIQEIMSQEPSPDDPPIEALLELLDRERAEPGVGS
jgi:hypothetical protein